jgi:hypothetical protein
MWDDPQNEVNPRFHGLSLLLIVGVVQDSLPRLTDDSSKRGKFEFAEVCQNPYIFVL